MAQYESGASLHKKAHMELLRSDHPMQSPSDIIFEADRMYRVQLAYAVPAIPGKLDGHHLRPCDRVLVTGAFAETIMDAIVSAKLVG
jgi:hypothetical protein